MRIRHIIRHGLSLSITVTAIILLALQALLGMPVSAAESENSYGHTVIYAPQPLNAGGKELLFFDYDMTIYNEKIASKSTSQQLSILDTYKLNLNKFGTLYYKEGKVDAGSTFNGKVDNTDDKEFAVYYDFSKLMVGEFDGASQDGNIRTLLLKKDVKFAFAYKVYLRRYDQNNVVSKTDKSTIATVVGFGDFNQWTGTEGNRWERVNYTSQDKLNLTGSDTWNDWSPYLMFMDYYGDSFNGGPVDTKMENGVLVGRDYNGPRIKSVNLSWSPDGPWEYKPDGRENDAWQGIDAIRVEDIGKTVYIGVVFDEPVKFSEKFDTPEELSKLKLTIQTLGRDGSTATPAEADFLKYAPDADTSAPVMIFEYKIQDPETSIRKDLYYEFSSVNISSTENKDIYDCLTDMAGNPYEAKSGVRGSNTVPVTNKSRPGQKSYGNPKTVVDLETLTIDSAVFSHTYNGTYIEKNERMYVALHLNKTLSQDSEVPDITLNIKDSSGEYIKMEKYGMYDTIRNNNDPLHTVIFYRYDLSWGSGFLVDDKGPIKIRSVSTEGKTIKDRSGYLLTVPETVPLDGNYYIDFTPPDVHYDLEKVDSAENVYKITAEIKDDSLWGREISFFASSNLISNDPIKYQVSSDGSYGDIWQEAANSKSFIVNAHLISTAEDDVKKAYLFIKLPKNDTYMTKLYINASITDAAGNTGYYAQDHMISIDTGAPEVELVRQYKKDRFCVKLTARDYSDMSYRYKWIDGHDGTKPEDWTEGGDLDTYYDYPYYSGSTDGLIKTGQELLEYIYEEHDMEENRIYDMTLWVEVTDKHGNVVYQRIYLTFDNQYSAFSIEDKSHSDTVGIIKDKNLSVTVRFENTMEYAYAWLEWGYGFEADGGEAFKNSAANEGRVFGGDGIWTPLTTTPAAVTFTLDSDTKVWRISDSFEASYEYGESVGQADADEISGPIMLAICGIYRGLDAERYTYEFVPFNTRYVPGNYEAQLIRFTTNGPDGKRIDRQYESFRDGPESFTYGYGLYYPHRPGTVLHNAVNMSLIAGSEGVNPTALNSAPLYDFAEAEFILTDDPAIGLESLKLTGEPGGTKVYLKKRTFRSDGSMEYQFNSDPDTDNAYSFSFKDDVPVSEEIIQTWYLTDSILKLAEGNRRLGSSMIVGGNNQMYLMDYSLTLPVDTSLIEPCAYDKDGDLIRYEFWIEYAYQDHYDVPGKSELLAMFAFEKRLPEPMLEAVKAGGADFGDSGIAVQANLAVDDADGSEIIIDNTVSPLRVFYKGDEPELRLKLNMPENAFNMLSNYSISAERADWGTKTIIPGHDYHIRYSTDINEIYWDDNENAFIIYDNSISRAELENGTFMIDLKDIAADAADAMAEGKPLTIYYQLVKDEQYTDHGTYPGDLRTIKRYAPVYRIDLIRDEIEPEINLYISETDLTNGDVEVSIQNVSDGRWVGSYYVMDTPAEEIRINVSARYENGDEIPRSENGTYIFTRNGTIDVTAKDKAGNTSTESYKVENIDKAPPEISGDPVISITDGSFTISADIKGGDAVDSYITFDNKYTAHLLDLTDASAAEKTGYRFSAKGSETFGIFMKKDISGGESDSIELLIYAKSGVPLTTAVLHVVDAAGNAGELPMTIGIDGIVPVVTNPGKIYNYGEALTFSGPVRLVSPVGSEKGYAVSHNDLPIYADGPVIVTYTDIFGSTYHEQITADVVGEAYAHSIDITPAGPTNGSVTVTVDTAGHDTKVLGPGGEYNDLRTFTLSDNGSVEYTIIPDGGMPAKVFTIMVDNIDKKPPEALYSRTVNGEEAYDEEGSFVVRGSVTYTIIGFDENDVTMDDGQEVRVTFTAPGSHVFRFTDAAGNKGELTVSETDTVFLPYVDLDFARFKLTYTIGEETIPVQLGWHYSDEEAPAFLTTNRDIAVSIQAVNAAGDVIPATMEMPSVPADGVHYFTDKNTLVFTKNASASVSLNISGSRQSVTVTIPDGTIDKIPPTGTVEYVMLTENETLSDGTEFAKGTVKAYLKTDETDIGVSGYDVRYDPEDGRYYIHFAENGSGKFYLTDKAGNTGIVMAGAYSIDNTPPGITSESWYSSIAAKPDADDGTSGNDRDDVLSTITNNSIRLYFVFDELIRNVEISAYFAEDGTKIPDAMLGSYINFTHSANTLNIEFKQNCQAEITVYDLRGNSVTLFRPEDGPVSVIDKQPPEYTESGPIVEDNVVRITYTFNEDVASANAFSGYKKVHEIEFDKNGVYSLTFADRAGNVANIIVNIDQIDDESPVIYYALKIVPETAGVIYSDEGKTQPAATNGNVEIAIAAEDDNEATIKVYNQNKPGLPLETKAPTIGGGASRSYTHAVTAEENGVYQIVAADKYGNTNTVLVRISFIDKEAPAILMESSKTVYTAAETEPSELTSLLMEGVSAKDGREGDLTSKITVDISGVDLSSEGVYTAVYRVQDGLGNAAERERKVSVTGSELHSLVIAGIPVPANDVFVSVPGDISISAPSGYKLYAAEGYMTRAQMKYTPMLTGDLKATNKGYYTILAQSGDRDSIIVYIYVY